MNVTTQADRIHSAILKDGELYQWVLERPRIINNADLRDLVHAAVTELYPDIPRTREARIAGKVMKKLLSPVLQG